MEDGTLVEAEEGGQRCPPHGSLLKIVGMSHRTDRARWYSTEAAARQALVEFRPASHGTVRESARVVEVVPSAVPGMGRAAFALALAVALAFGLPSPVLAGEKPVESPAEKFCRENPRGRDFIADASCPSGRRLVTCTPLGPQLAPCDAVRPGVQPASVSGDEWVPCSDPEHRIPVVCQGTGHGRCNEGCPTKCSNGHPVACSCCQYVPSVSVDVNWPESQTQAGHQAAACQRKDGGAGLVPCCWDVPGNYMGECGIELPPAPSVPKIPWKPAGETAGLRNL